MQEVILEFFAGLPTEFYVFVISILPIIELRGAIPAGAILGLEFYICYPIAVLGNLLPVPFILLFISKIMSFLYRFKFCRPVIDWLRRKANKHSDKVIVKSPNDIEAENAETDDMPEGMEKINPRRTMSSAIFWALTAFVAIPLPGTGAWTGALICALFDLPKKSSFPAIALGVLISGVIMSLASYGAVEFLSFLL